MKNRIMLEHAYLPGDLDARIDAFVTYYNYSRLHEILSNLTPVDVYYGRGEAILEGRRGIKRITIANHRLQHQLQAA